MPRDDVRNHLDRIYRSLEKYGKSANSLVESALYNVGILEKFGVHDIAISVKASSVPLTVRAYTLLSQRTEYPLHLGVTEAGTTEAGVVKSAVGIGSLLLAGIGDTLRVSLTEDPVEEIYAAREILSALDLTENRGMDIVSCPTCGRTQIDLIGLATKVEKMVEDYPLDIKVAVMGCVVNGPGEAKEADIGIAGGIGEGLLIKKGEIIRKVPESELLSVLKEELDNWK